MKYLLSSSAVRPLIRAFISDQVETVVIKGEHGPVRINKADFNDKEHTLHKANKTHDENGVPRKQSSETIDGNSPTGQVVEQNDDERKERERIAAMNLGVVQEGMRFFIVDMNADGKRVDDVKGIDKNGYESNKQAWDELFTVRTRATAPVATNDVNVEANADPKAKPKKK